MTRRFWSMLALAIMVAATGCSSPRSDQNVDITDANNPRSAVQVDPQKVIDHLKSANLPITRLETYNVDDDPYKLAGRPDRYASKIVFQDGRYSNKGCDAASPIPWDECGGAVESFASASDLRKWLQAIVVAREQTPNAPPEYRYENGLTLLRLGHILTPDQAKAYEAAFKTFSPQSAN